jgi:hypothetical protein
MSKNIQVKDYLNNFNRKILDLQGVGITIDNDDQIIILLCSLPNSYENFVDTILYGKYSISSINVKDTMHSKELKRKVSNSNEDKSDVGLVVSRGRNKEMNGKGRNKSHSKLRSGGLWHFHGKEIERIKKDFP